MHQISRNTFLRYSLAGLIILYLFARNSILREIADSKLNSIGHQYGMHIRYSQARFQGLNGISFRGLTVVLLPADTLVQIDTLIVKPRILPALIGRVRLRTLEISGMEARMNASLLELWLNRHKKDTVIVQSALASAGYAGTLRSLESKLFVTIPRRVNIQNAVFNYTHDSLFSSLECKSLIYKQSRFNADMLMWDNYSHVPFVISGRISKSKHRLSAMVRQVDSSMVKLPYIGARWQATIGFDTLALQVSFRKGVSGVEEIEGKASAVQFLIAHKRISPEPVRIANGSFDFRIHTGGNFIELDSSSQIQMNGFTCSPYLRFAAKPGRTISLAFIEKEFPAQELFDALPGGLFPTFRGILTSGKLNYRLKAVLPLDNPDSVVFESRLNSRDFKIIHFGETDFRLLNGDFSDEVYDEDRLVAVINVSSENPDFVPLNAISAYLRYSVLTAEDGSFFYHNGFNEDAFRESIITNLKEKRFARGGSTISMQLVKNVFLNKKKTISRKVEEALIVWIIENQHLVSKERMFEVYLNIIEWGPGIYGIKAASRFYFDKDPADLNLNESIYLSAIIPRPKGFRYAFVKNGELKPYMAEYYHTVSEIMLRRNQIMPSDTLDLNTSLTLRGEAKLLLSVPDTLREEMFYLLPVKVLLPEEIQLNGK
jgi:hypothetical protein